MKNKEAVTMEDINSWIYVAMDKITKDVEIDSILEDKIWQEMQAVLERNFNYPNYANHN